MKAWIPNILTCFNLLTGAVGIVYIFEFDPRYALYFVLIAGLFDFLDGLLARILNVKSEVGKQLDSLADMVSFGVFPSLFMYRFLAVNDFYYLKFGAFLIAVFSGLRLAIFNADDRQTEKFIGVPTPANAFFITAFGLIAFDIPSWLWVMIIFTSSALMVAPWEMLSLKFQNMELKNNLFRYILIVMSLVVLIMLGLQGFVLLLPIYVLLSAIANFQNGKKV